MDLLLVVFIIIMDYMDYYLLLLYGFILGPFYLASRPVILQICVEH